MSILACPVRVVALASILLPAPGCGLMHRSRLDDCARRVQALQAETTQLKDETLGLRARNRDLTQRAVDDARRLRVLAETNRSLESSLLAYQEERAELYSAFEEVQRLVRSSAGLGPTAQTESPDQGHPGPDRLEAFAQSQPGCRYDPDQGTWSFPAELLFQPGGSEWKPGAEMIVRAFGRVMDDPNRPALPARVAGLSGSSAVQRTGSEPYQDPAPALAVARARRVRDLLAEGLGLDAYNIPIDGPAESKTEEQPAAIVVHIEPRPARSR